jgi:beta-fructofuranosidase
LASGENLRLDIFIDHQVIEVFANGRQCMTQVVYPELEESGGVKLFSEGETVMVYKVEAWHMAETNAY